VSELSFGRTILDASAQQILDAESAADLHDRFAQPEQLLDHVVARAFHGLAVIERAPAASTITLDTLSLAGLDEAQRERLDNTYRLDRQEGRGAWFLPEELSLKYGLANLPAHMAQQPRFAVNAARDATAKVDLRSAPDAIVLWALVLPLFTDLLAPIDLRTATGKVRTREEQLADWAVIDDTYSDLRIDVAAHLGVMRYGGGWSRLHLNDQTAAKYALVAGLAPQVTLDTVRRWRARQVRALTTAYYRKASKGPPLARAVLTKPLQATLAGVFGGDWLAFLNYLGERPNEGEKIATNLPAPRLFVGGSAKAAAIAAEQNLPIDEVERMLGALLGHGSGASPVQERVAVMGNWWQAFDRVHAAQRTGMPPLWGLVDDGHEVIASGLGAQPGLYRRLLPSELSSDIDRLWDGVTLRRWPERIVSEFHPHHQMVDAFGPAVDLWHGVALTSWYVCEGPYSRTDLDGLADYYRRPLDALAEAGFAISPGLFVDLVAAKKRLGPVQEIERSRTVDSAKGVAITMSYRIGERREGFAVLRDIVTAHRRSWAAQNLDAYLHQRWERELREVATEFNRRTAARNKPPTFKQFATFAVPAANHWFCGDLVGVYAALGESAPTATTRHDLLAGDPYEFVFRVFTSLGGLPNAPLEPTDPNYQQQWDIRHIASQSLRYLQLAEALDRRPSPKEFGAERLRWDHLGGHETGWAMFEHAVDGARQASAVGPAAQPPAQSTGLRPEPPAPATPKGFLGRRRDR